MKRLIRNLLLWSALSPLYISCSEKIEPQPATYSQLLTGTTKKTWRLVTVRVIDNGEDSGAIPINEVLNACEADDQYVFYANAEKQFEYTDGPLKCSPDDPDLLLTTNWALVNANATLEMPIPAFFGGSLVPFTIKSLTETTLTVELYWEKFTPDQLNASYRFTFNSSNR